MKVVEASLARRDLWPPVLIVLCAALAAASAMAQAPAQRAAPRGELLYNTHCIECHTTQMHWREQRQARDWDSLKMQVRRWQDSAGLKWSDSDIAEVARHLNDTIYHFPQTTNRMSQASPQGTALSP